MATVGILHLEDNEIIREVTGNQLSEFFSKLSIPFIYEAQEGVLGLASSLRKMKEESGVVLFLCDLCLDNGLLQGDTALVSICRNYRGVPAIIYSAANHKEREDAAEQARLARGKGGVVLHCAKHPQDLLQLIRELLVSKGIV